MRTTKAQVRPRFCAVVARSQNYEYYRYTRGVPKELLVVSLLDIHMELEKKSKKKKKKNIYLSIYLSIYLYIYIYIYIYITCIALPNIFIVQI